MGEKESGAKAAAVDAREQEREPALPPCECGCGRRVRKAGQRYVVGHHLKHQGHFSASEVAASLAQQCLTACALCDWQFEGTMQGGHSAFLTHMAAHHRNRAA